MGRLKVEPELIRQQCEPDSLGRSFLDCLVTLILIEIGRGISRIRRANLNGRAAQLPRKNKKG